MYDTLKKRFRRYILINIHTFGHYELQANIYSQGNISCVRITDTKKTLTTGWPPLL